MKRIAVFIGLACVGLVAAAPTQASIHGLPNFAGSCSIKGTATFASPLKAVPGLNSYSFASTEPTGADPSTCTGTLFDGELTRGTQTWKVRASAGNNGVLSCLGSVVPGPTSGNAALEFFNPDGSPVLRGTMPVVLRASLTTVAAGSHVTLHLRGGTRAQYPGGTNGTGSADFVADEATTNACAGDGVSSLAFTASITTGPSLHRPTNTVRNVLISLTP